MRCYAKIILLILIAILWLMPVASSAPYVHDRVVYFPSRSGSYIRFDDALIPFNLSIQYRDSFGRWHFNDTWITTTQDLTIHAWSNHDWINYTVTSAGVQTINCTSEPTNVYFDGTPIYEGYGWNWTAGVLTLTPAGTVVSVDLDGDGDGNGEEPVLPDPVPWQLFFNETANLAFESDTNQYVTLEMRTGALNATSFSLTMQQRTGRFTYTSLENHTMIVDGVNCNVGVQGDGGRLSRTIGNNELIRVYAGNTIVIRWNYPIESWLDLYFMVGIGFAGIILMVFSLSWFGWLASRKGLDPLTIERGGYSMILFIIGFGLVVVWLWS